MKLFIWENVLWKYTPGLAGGLAVAYAKTYEEALKMFGKDVASELDTPTKVIDCEVDKEAFVTYAL